MAGRDRRKENRTAKLRSNPRIIPAEMVAPDREMPGIMATAWAQPTSSASVTVAFFAVLRPRASRSEKKRMKPVRSSIQDTGMELTKRASMAPLRNTITKRGNVPRMISITSRRAGGGAPRSGRLENRAAMPRKNSRIISTMSRQ